MTIEIALLISIVSAAFAIYFGIKSSKRADVSDVTKKAEETAIINVKLDQIGGDVRDIKYDMSTLKRDVQELTERVIVVEQSTKSAHHRIDSIEGKEERS